MVAVPRFAGDDPMDVTDGALKDALEESPHGGGGEGGDSASMAGSEADDSEAEQAASLEHDEDLAEYDLPAAVGAALDDARWEKAHRRQAYYCDGRAVPTSV